MGNNCTSTIKIKPKKPVSELSYRVENVPKAQVVRFADKNIFYPDSRIAISAESLEARAKKLMLRTIIEQAAEEDKEFINELTKKLMIAKQAMDECLYNDILSRSNSYSIVPFVHIEK